MTLEVIKARKKTYSKHIDYTHCIQVLFTQTTASQELTFYE